MLALPSKICQAYRLGAEIGRLPPLFQWIFYTLLAGKSKSQSFIMTLENMNKGRIKNKKSHLRTFCAKSTLFDEKSRPIL